MNAASVGHAANGNGHRSKKPAVTFGLVLANVVRGQVVYLVLTKEQKRQLRDPDGQLALQGLRHLLGARADRHDPERFPLIEFALQAVLRKLGHDVGQKRCRVMIQRLRTSRVIVVRGQYRQEYESTAARDGFKVTLYRLARRAGSARRRPRFQAQRPVGTPGSVKPRFRVPWWQHPLFGDLLGLPPPELTRENLRRMRPLDWRSGS